MSLIKKRILNLIKEKGMTKYQFYKNTGITRGVLDGDTGISEDNLIKFITCFQDVDLNWLLKGESNLRTEQNVTFSDVKHNLPKNKDFIKDEIIRLLVRDEEIQKAFQFFIGKEMNSFISLKLLDLVKEEGFLKTILNQINKSKINDKDLT